MAIKKRAKGASGRAAKRTVEDPRRRLALAEAIAPVAVLTHGAALDRGYLLALRAADLAEPVGARTTVGLPPPSVVRRDLLRYYALVDGEQKATDAARAALFRADSLAALREACAGVAFESARQVETLWAFGVMAWGGDDARTRYLRTEADPLTRWALVDALESGRAGDAPAAPASAAPVGPDLDTTEGATDG